MKKVSSVFLVIGILLALTFTFSCSQDGNSGGTDTSSSSVDGSSSSSGDSSSSITGNSSSSSLVISSSSAEENSSSSILEDTDSSSSSEISSSSAYSSGSIEQSSSSIAECNGEEYNEINEFCFEDTVYEKCSNKIYNPAKQKCDENTVQNHCNGTLYDTYLEYCVDGILKDKGEFIDDRDQKTYKTVDIGSQTWMAENLNYNASNSYCYGDGDAYYNLTTEQIQAYCAKYGRLYNLTTAMESCPSGWHLPSREEWEQLINYVGEEAAGTKLKANSDLWKSNTSGADDYGFSALPGGYGVPGYGFQGGVSLAEYWHIGNYGRWWSSTKHPTYSDFYYLQIESNNARISSEKNYWFSIRCVKDI